MVVYYLLTSCIFTPVLFKALLLSWFNVFWSHCIICLYVGSVFFMFDNHRTQEEDNNHIKQLIQAQ